MKHVLFLILFAFSSLNAFTNFAKSEDIAHQCPSALFLAVHHGQVSDVAFLLERGVDPNHSLQNCSEIFPEEMSMYPERITLAHAALYYPDYFRNTSEDIFKLLKSKSADIDIKDSNGLTAKRLYEHYLSLKPQVSGRFN